MKSLLLMLLTITSTAIHAQLLKNKFFYWNGVLPPGPSLILDDTYKLYMRSICRKDYKDYNIPVRVTVSKYDCQESAEPTVLVERQYLYYSAVHRNAIFIMLLPNYPLHENDSSAYNKREIRNAQVINLWSANCFLFGKMNTNQDTITFRRWADEGCDKWIVQMDEDGQSIRIKGVTEWKKGKDIVYRDVDSNLSVPVIYRLVPTVYPMNVDGTMFDINFTKCSLRQEFYYESLSKRKYRLNIPYNQCSTENRNNEAMYFKGKKERSNRIPYDPQEFFQIK